MTKSIDAFVAKYHSVVLSAVNIWCSKLSLAKNHRDQIYSEGMLALLRAAQREDKLHEEKEGAIKGYVYTAASNAMYDYLMQHTGSARIPISAPMGLAAPHRANYQLREDEIVMNDHYKKLIDTDELLEGCCVTDLHRDVMRLKMANFTHEEIADQLNVSTRRVTAVRDHVSSRCHSRIQREII